MYLYIYCGSTQSEGHLSTANMMSLPIQFLLMFLMLQFLKVVALLVHNLMFRHFFPEADWIWRDFLSQLSLYKMDLQPLTKVIHST